MKMKKLLIALVIMAAFCASATAALIPDWVDDMQPGDMYTSGEYQTSMGFAEEEFTPTDFHSEFSFGTPDIGGYIAQDLSTDITGISIGDVDRQVMGQSASAYIATSDEGFEWDPETPNQAITAQIGITKDQFAAFSGAIVAGEDDIFVQQIDDGPSWTATFSDYADVGSLVSGSPVVLYQEMAPSTVTVSAGGIGGISGQAIDGIGAQLTEVGATSHSDVTLTQTMYNIGTKPFVVNSMDGSATLGGAFENAFLDAGVPVTISMNSNGFNFWWDQGLMPT